MGQKTSKTLFSDDFTEILDSISEIVSDKKVIEDVRTRLRCGDIMMTEKKVIERIGTFRKGRITDRELSSLKNRFTHFFLRAANRNMSLENEDFAWLPNLFASVLGLVCVDLLSDNQKRYNDAFNFVYSERREDKYDREFVCSAAGVSPQLLVQFANQILAFRNYVIKRQFRENDKDEAALIQPLEMFNEESDKQYCLKI